MRILIPILILLIISSCEKVIDVDLNSSNPKVVIEAVITNNPGPYKVTLTKTADYFNPQEYPLISGAEVMITDNLGNSEILTEKSAGNYETSTIEGIPGRTYSLSVNIDGETFSSTSAMPIKTLIDSITSTEMPFMNPHSQNSNKQYRISCYFKDSVGVNEFFRIIAYKNREKIREFYLLDDKISDGVSLGYGGIMGDIFLGDTVDIELLKIDQKVFEFYNTLANVIVGAEGMRDNGTPANPNTNISNGALGYFGAVAMDKKTIIVE
ncbi:MAG: hypothetical protein A2033_05750 [Bacteroidetes bacterium GWA2_31_9]|nr:MAG: hypothetical protein A2033_05750 [Bacteroidetes bacterium GWA2_31_9]